MRLSTCSLLIKFYMVVMLTMVSCPLCTVQAKNSWASLFPSSCYSRALEVCMRVLDDANKSYDVVTSEDLCAGRFMRLLQEVSAVAYVHINCTPYPPEDIEYMLSLIERIKQEKQAQINSSRVLRSLVRSIQMKLAQLLIN